MEAPNLSSQNGTLEEGNQEKSTSARNKRLRCGICGEKYRLPRILPCLHTFCTDCICSLQTYPANQEEASSSSDTDHTSDWLVPSTAGNSAENLLEEGDARTALTSSAADVSVVPKAAIPRGRSRHAKLIEKRIIRSNSCHENDATGEGHSSHRVNVVARSSNDLSNTLEGLNLAGASSVCFVNDVGERDNTEDLSIEETRVVLCPDCLREVKIPVNLDDLPRNFMMERLVAHDALTKATNNLRCDSCCDDDDDDDDDDGDADRDGGDGEQTRKSVTARCVECQENLCSLCEFSHRRQKKTKSHQLILLEYSLRTSNCNNSKSNGDISSCSNSNSTNSSMTTIPESVREEIFNQEKANPSHRPKVLKNITRLKLPNLQQFGKLLKDIGGSVGDVRHGDSGHGDGRHGDGERKDTTNSENQPRDEDLKVADDTPCDVSSSNDVSNIRPGMNSGLEHTTRLTKIPRTEREGQDFSKRKKISSSFWSREKLSTENISVNGDTSRRKKSPKEENGKVEGLTTARVLHACLMTLTVCDTEAVPYTGNDVRVRAWVIVQEQNIKSTPVTLTPFKDGIHQLSFTPTHKGTHFLHVAVNGEPVHVSDLFVLISPDTMLGTKDSPLRFNVKARWRRHDGVWQCCTFCTTSGRRDVICGCGATSPGGYLGCTHGQGSHPGGQHWSCCGKMNRDSECSGRPALGSRPSPMENQPVGVRATCRLNVHLCLWLKKSIRFPV
ncbi:tripartite motif-containing protein 45-like [Aplysia californica]|uniref:Tripartite motif-containing protein 45-like n=1 Tax=Aplysia californica TaxID=6500 RepID=A0ABM0K8Y7_APLCA|nr:tripartite motif-containing protein 45-like [Aplysia californica]